MVSIKPIKSSDYNDGYIAGQWSAFNYVLNYLNTLESREIPKNKLYAAIMDMRPEIYSNKESIHLNDTDDVD